MDVGTMLGYMKATMELFGIWTVFVSALSIALILGLILIMVKFLTGRGGG